MSSSSTTSIPHSGLQGWTDEQVLVHALGDALAAGAPYSGAYAMVHRITERAATWDGPLMASPQFQSLAEEARDWDITWHLADDGTFTVTH